MLVRIVLHLDRAPLQRRLQKILAQRHVLVTAAEKRADLWSQLARESFDLLVISHSLLEDPVQSLVGTVRKLPDRPDVIVVWDQEDPQRRAALLAAGCLAAVYQDLTDQALADTFGSLIARKREEALRGLRAGERAEEQSRIGDFVSSSPAMQKFMTVVRRVMSTDSSLLILGETGVGKERLARAIHLESPRAAGPFIAVNCAALPEGLLESELFGHTEGAFTGATRPRRGFFELAHRGTIFLDEVGEMPLHLQTRLLRVLQERRIQPVGSESALEIDVRVMAATNRDLAADMARREFRADLYYRLGVVTLTLPPLRDRREDIPALVQSYLEHFSSRLRRPVTGTAPDAMRVLVDYPWPGNVRELINVMERAVLLCGGAEISAADLPDNLANPARLAGDGAALIATGGIAATAAAAAPSSAAAAALALQPSWVEKPWREARDEVLLAVERTYLVALLERHRGRIGDSARQAGMAPRSLFEKMRQHGLRKESFTSGRAAPSAAASPTGAVPAAALPGR